MLNNKPKTCLFDAHLKSSAKMVDFAGWQMPVQYTSIISEHIATRETAGLFDISHMGEFMITGPESLKDLSMICTHNVAKQNDNSCSYGFILNESAGIIDDCIVYKFNPRKWMIVVNASREEQDRDWIKGHLSSSSNFEVISKQTAKIDVQGPESTTLLRRAFGLDLRELGFFRFIETSLESSPTIISRTGYTGELGYEIYTGCETAPLIWKKLSQAGAVPAGLGARDTLRVEAGLPLYGHEFDEDTSPVQAGMKRFASKESDFIGKQALLEQTNEGRMLRGFILDSRRKAPEGAPVMINSRQAGSVTSAVFSPLLKKAIGIAVMDKDKSDPDNSITINTARVELSGKLIKLPFYRNIKGVKDKLLAIKK